jgi:transcriptional regulator with XRE-family HTH domain
VSSRRDRSRELGEFLRARRSELDPVSVGVGPRGQVRRVPGLRRDEVAQLAMISTDYYTRLEQGRLTGASAGVLDALATALQLGEDERSYLYQLAQKDDERRQARTRSETVRPQTAQLLDNLRDTPAMVLGCYLDVLAWNPLAAAVFRDFAVVPRRERNFLRMLFLDPLVRGRYVEWSSIARVCVGFVRAAADRPGAQRMAELIGELSVRDKDFRTWWAERHASYQMFGTKTLTHPATGDYDLDWQVLRTADEDQTLMVMTAPPGSAGLQALHTLAATGGVGAAPQ